MDTDFDEWAEIYDTVYSYVREDIPFYIEEARRSDGPVLELGCGTGRVTIPIAQSGTEVIGLDSSTGMLAKAQDKVKALSVENSNISFLHEDMRNFSVNQKFGLVIIPFRGFLSLLSVSDQANTLSMVKKHLAPGGRLVFNIFVPDLEMLVQEGDLPYYLRDVTDPETGDRLVLWHQSTYDNYNQIISTRLIGEELDNHGQMTRRFYQDFQVRYSHLWEMHHLLNSCGYAVKDLYGNFDRVPLDETSTEMVWVVKPL
jgi:SAM-dependent methyltransferase